VENLSAGDGGVIPGPGRRGRLLTLEARWQAAERCGSDRPTLDGGQPPGDRHGRGPPPRSNVRSDRFRYTEHFVPDAATPRQRLPDGRHVVRGSDARCRREAACGTRLACLLAASTGQLQRPTCASLARHPCQPTLHRTQPGPPVVTRPRLVYGTAEVSNGAQTMSTVEGWRAFMINVARLRAGDAATCTTSGSDAMPVWRACQLPDAAGSQLVAIGSGRS
jgi:hypothetical protein